VHVAAIRIHDVTCAITGGITAIRIHDVTCAITGGISTRARPARPRAFTVVKEREIHVGGRAPTDAEREIHVGGRAPTGARRDRVSPLRSPLGATCLSPKRARAAIAKPQPQTLNPKP
jgi:hypothetical protein